MTAAASAIGLQIDVLQASDSREIESVFGTLVHNKADALLVGPDAFFASRRLQLAILAARHALPTVYNVREYAEAGGLMSYGTNVREVYRQIGVYVGRILKGATTVSFTCSTSFPSRYRDASACGPRLTAI